MRNPNNHLLWKNETFSVHTPNNPHITYDEGVHLVIEVLVEPHPQTAWENPALTGQAFELAARVCRVVENLKLAPWFNIQSNGNWGLLPGATKFFHVHIYGRNQTERWGKPVIIPEVPKTYQHDPMPETDRQRLAAALAGTLQAQ